MYDPREITKLLVFGTNTPSPSDYNQHIRPLSAPKPSITYNMATYMNSGGGRFAYPSLFGAIKKFFSSTLPAETYNYANILAQQSLNLSPKDFESQVGS